MAILTSPYNHLLIPEYQSLPDFFFCETEKYGDKTAIICPTENKTYSFNQLKALVCQLSAGLHQFGVRKGDVIGIFFNTLQLSRIHITFLGCSQIGSHNNYMQSSIHFRWFPLDLYSYCTVVISDELVDQMTNCKVRYIFTEAEFIGKVNNVRNRMPDLKEIAVIRAGHVTYFPKFEDVLAMGKCVNEANILPTIDAKNYTCFIFYSSGMTGLPKGVMLTHYHMYCNTYLLLNMKGSEPVLELSSDDVALYVLPFFHAGGVYLGILWILLQGCPLVITPKYEPNLFLTIIQKYKVTTLVLVPPVIVFLAKSPLVQKFNLSSVRNVLSAGAPMPTAAADQMIDRIGIRHLIQMYGMTELGVISHLQPISVRSKTKKGTVCVVVPNTRCKIVDPETLQCLGSGKSGEIWVQSQTLMKGYMNNPNATNEIITSDGWLRTGDMGRYDQDGYFFIEDRLKELIKVRGFQFAPAELEELILTHHAVADVIVTSIPDLYSGELPRAYVVLKCGEKTTEEEIKEFVKNNVARYKQLAGGVQFLSELPKTSSGKPLRRILRSKVREEMKSKL